MINNCSAPHYTVLLQLGEDGVHMNNFTFMNFVSLKLIIEGEIKENVSIHISNFKGVFGNVLGKTFNTIIYYILIYEQGVQKKTGILVDKWHGHNSSEIHHKGEKSVCFGKINLNAAG